MVETLNKWKQALWSVTGRIVHAVRERPHIARILVGVLLLLIFIYGLRIIKERDSSPLMFSSSSRSDFEDYYRAATRLRAGKDPYNMELLRKFKAFRLEPGDLQKPEKLAELLQFRSIGSYLYPPFTAYVLQPFTFLPYRGAAALFQILSILSFSLCLLVYARFARIHNGSFWFPALCTILLLLRFCMENSSNGNIAFFLILFCGVGLVLAWSSNRIVEFLGGLLLGVSAVIKVTPAFFGLVIFAGRRKAAVGGMVAGAILALALPALSFGWEQNLHLINDWRKFLLDSFQEIGFIRPWANNQTISAAIGKLFVPFSDPGQGRFGLPLVYGGGIPDEAKRFLANLVRFVNLFLYGIGALVAILIAFFRPSKNVGFLADVGAARMTMLAVLISLVGSGVSWYHAYCILFIPLLARIYQHFSLGLSLVRLEKVAIGIIAVFGFGRLLLPSEIRAVLSMYSIFAWLAVGMVAIYIYLLLARPYRRTESQRA